MNEREKAEIRDRVARARLEEQELQIRGFSREKPKKKGKTPAQYRPFIVSRVARRLNEILKEWNERREER